jgi:hypothetical protein
VALAGCLVLGLLVLPEVRRAPGKAVAVLVAAALGAWAVNAWFAPSFGPGAHVFSPKGSEGRPTSVVDLPEFASLRGLFLPPARSTASVVHPNWLGFVALIAGGMGVERRPWLGVTAGILAILALGPRLGPVPLPWALLADLAPSISQSMSAYRMVAGVVLTLAIAAACVDWGRVAWLLVALAWIEGPLAATRPLPLAAQYVPFDGGTAERRAGSGAVLDLPLAGPACPEGAAHYLLQAARTGRPTPVTLTNPRAGYSGDVVRTFGTAEHCEDLADNVRSWGFTTVVLHIHDPNCPASPALRGCLSVLGPGQSEPGTTWWDLGGSP